MFVVAGVSVGLFFVVLWLLFCFLVVPCVVVWLLLFLSLLFRLLFYLVAVFIYFCFVCTVVGGISL